MPLTRFAGLRAGLMIACALIAAPGAYAARLIATDNFHPIIEGQAYRSAQPDAQDLVQWARQKGIRSVVNLRGAAPDAGWYREEIAASERLGIVHADFAMSASVFVPPAKQKALLDLIADLPKPVLIHCRSGADRTGLAAALYLAAEGAGEAAAEQQISLLFGHVSLPVSAAWAMDESWEAAEAGFGYAS